ncbi:MAG: carboxyl-terminal processing protease [Gemmatimonadaceae bacterium]|jgi:carboxyl-terminal processing protease|nr:carboxyl-terminal processing protease [Gemmatimonadaceae bacterium]
MKLRLPSASARARAVIVAGTLFGALITGGWLLQRGSHTGAFTEFEGAQLFENVLRHVQNDFVDPISDSTLYRKSVDGMLYELRDPYSTFLPPERLASLNESTSGNYAGLGLETDLRDGWLIVVAPMPGGPAERAGLQPGDRIVEIMGKPAKGWTSEEASKALRGKAGTPVSLKIERPGAPTPMDMKLVRSTIHQSAVRRTSMLGDGVGYIDLKAFSDSTGNELNGAITNLLAHGMKTLLLDLRTNPGGLLNQGVKVSDLFLNPGQKIVSMRGRLPEANREFADTAQQRWPDLPLIVLVDGRSASAAEIVAGALQDHDRAVIVGTPTYGKGSAQSVVSFGDQGGLKLTTARWFTPAGRSITRPRPTDDEIDDAPLVKRERFLTDAGRVVFGGGGITPDVIAGDSIIPVAEGNFIHALGANGGHFRDAVTDYALYIKATHGVSSPDFVVTPAMRDEIWNRMKQRGIDIPRSVFDEGEPLVTRIIGYDIARYVFGSDAEFRRRASVDKALQRALELAHGSRSESDLLRKATAQAQPADSLATQ